MAEFFIPHLRENPAAAETEWQRYLGESGAPPGSRRVHKLTYEDGRGRYEVIVGERRKQFRLRTGPRGGRIPDAEFERLGYRTGTVVSGIIDTGDLLYVWSYGPPFGDWGNPQMVGRAGVRSIEYFDSTPAKADATTTES